MPGESSCGRLRSLLLCLCDIFWVLINSLARWFCTSALGPVLFQIVFILKHLSVFVANVLKMKPIALSFPYPSLTCSMHMYACTCTHMYACACTHMHMHACTNAHTHAHTNYNTKSKQHKISFFHQPLLIVVLHCNTEAHPTLVKSLHVQQFPVCAWMHTMWCPLPFRYYLHTNFSG